MNNIEDELDVSSRFKKDTDYINDEVIAQQPNGAYTKWSRALRAVTVVNISYKQYIDFWIKQYKSHPEYIDKIIAVCENKLNNGLIPRKDMIELIKNSKDIESEKINAIIFLGGKYE